MRSVVQSGGPDTEKQALCPTCHTRRLNTSIEIVDKSLSFTAMTCQPSRLPTTATHALQPHTLNFSNQDGGYCDGGPSSSAKQGIGTVQIQTPSCQFGSLHLA